MGQLKIVMEATHCELCKKEFPDEFDKVIDHLDLGTIRGILCRNCNTSIKSDQDANCYFRAYQYVKNYEEIKEKFNL